MKDENLNKIEILCNDSGEYASPLGHIFYQHINVENKDYRNYIKDNILTLYIKLPNERGQDMYSKLHTETPCDDGKMLTALLNFPDIPMKLLSRELPQLRKIWKLKECVYLFDVYKSNRDNGEYSQFSKNIFDKKSYHIIIIAITTKRF